MAAQKYSFRMFGDFFQSTLGITGAAALTSATDSLRGADFMMLGAMVRDLC